MAFLKKVATSLAIACCVSFGFSNAPTYAIDEPVSGKSLNLEGNNAKIWDNLSKEQQQEVIDVVNDPEFRIGMTQEEAISISPNLVIEVDYKVKNDSPTSRLDPLNASVAGGSYAVTSDYTERTSLLGIELGWSKIEYRYVTGNNRVLESRSCVGTYNQIVPFRNVNVSTNHWLSGGEGTCIADWSVSRGAGILGTERWEQGMTVNGPGIKNR